MAKKTIESAFELGEKVLVVDHEITGVINSIWLQRTPSALAYQVEWLDLSNRINTKWFSEAELKSIE